ncbi:MAG: T9SS type A sorting domain-containing protein, partial [Bacteroidota bacterium]
EITSVPTITAAEYFIDTDAGFGNNKSIEVSGANEADTLRFNADLTGLTPGIHALYVRVKNANNHWSIVTQRTFVVVDEIERSNVVALNYYYYDEAEETIVGENAYTYSILNPSTNVDITFPANVSALESGKNYLMYVWAVDADNESSLVSTVRLAPFIIGSPIILDRVEVADIVCAGEDEGNATVFASGGEGTLLYSISSDSANYVSTNLFEGLAAGTYTAYVRDNVNTFVVEREFTITAPDELVLTEPIVQGVECPSDNTGSIEISASGGAGSGYQYSLNGNDFEESGVFRGLRADTYLITVRDANRCTKSLEVTVPSSNNALSAPTIRRSEESDFVDELSLIAENIPSGAEVQWYRNDTPISGATGLSVPITEAGSYYVEVSLGGCSAVSEPIIITGLQDLIAQNLRIYPVPAHKMITAEVPLDLTTDEIKATLLSAQGQILEVKSLSSVRAHQQVSFDISQLPTGLYLLSLQGEGFQLQKRITKR